MARTILSSKACQRDSNDVMLCSARKYCSLPIPSTVFAQSRLHVGLFSSKTASSWSFHLLPIQWDFRHSG